MPSLPTFTFTTTAGEVASVFTDQIRGKNVFVTGPTINGLGYETARVLSQHANLVIIAGYNLERLKLAESAVKSEFPAANIRPLVLDLASFASIRAAAAQVTEPLHVLIHNAAAPGGDLRLSEDHFEMHLAVDHIGPFLLTKLLAPNLLAAETATYTPRVVFVSSIAHAQAGVDLAMVTPHPDPARYHVYGAYGQAKTANILTARELSRRAMGRINAYSLHPGTVFTNAQLREAVKEHMMILGILGTDGLPNKEKFEWKTLAQGAATTVAAAFDTRLDDTPGAYLVDCVVADDHLSLHATDPAMAEKLWALTEEVIGERFVF
ncbi:Short-chain dehydrogenase/reductase family protein [Mycena sanguinolenta]|uniref:Short-chain dehydrogenase/reductase family protein n=1 Tax=Mycena sanguinolenta TaxID=230812 RepID=A0A8H6XI10_9AGAR|nr:Short-chain dehydrogenase/reductase family protein [Mycena sanguinolenta]